MSATAAAPGAACSRCSSPLEEGDLRCAVCALAVPAPAGPAVERPRVQLLRCGECGAAIGFDPAKQAPACAFCGSVMHVEQPVDPVETARVRVPFTVDRAAAESALRAWLGRRGFFAPKTLKDEAVLESLAPLGWAAWVVRAKARIAWTADSDYGSERSSWAPHAGELSLSFENIVVPASRGLRHEECVRLVPSYDLSAAVPADAPAALGEVIESFDAQRSAARALVTRSIESVAKHRVESVIPGTRFRNINVSCLLESQTTDRVALPAWVLAYRYRGSPYRAVVHGQRPEVVFGTSPTDWGKVAALVLGIGAAIAVIAAIIYVLTQR